MLNLLRKENQVVRIGEEIRIIVIEVSEGEVLLGFDVPRDITVDREEVYLKKKSLKDNGKNNSKKMIEQFKNNINKARGRS